MADADVIGHDGAHPQSSSARPRQGRGGCEHAVGSVAVDPADGERRQRRGFKKDEVVTTANGVSLIGYTDLASRLPDGVQPFGNNVAKFLLSVGPQTAAPRTSGRLTTATTPSGGCCD